MKKKYGKITIFTLYIVMIVAMMGINYFVSPVNALDDVEFTIEVLDEDENQVGGSQLKIVSLDTSSTTTIDADELDNLIYVDTSAHQYLNLYERYQFSIIKQGYISTIWKGTIKESWNSMQFSSCIAYNNPSSGDYVLGTVYFEMQQADPNPDFKDLTPSNGRINYVSNQATLKFGYDGFLERDEIDTYGDVYYKFVVQYSATLQRYNSVTQTWYLISSSDAQSDTYTYWSTPNNEDDRYDPWFIWNLTPSTYQIGNYRLLVQLDVDGYYGNSESTCTNAYGSWLPYNWEIYFDMAV